LIISGANATPTVTFVAGTTIQVTVDAAANATAAAMQTALNNALGAGKFTVTGTNATAAGTWVLSPNAVVIQLVLQLLLQLLAMIFLPSPLIRQLKTLRLLLTVLLTAVVLLCLKQSRMRMT
jgi:hypothetical protein